MIYKQTEILTSILCFFCFLIIVGCEKTRFTVTELPQKSDQPATQTAASRPFSDTDCQTVDEMDFLECMTHKTRCTAADAVRAVGLMLNGSDAGKTYEERYQFLKEKNIVRDYWHLKPDQWIDRGTLAYMLLRAGGIRGGVNLAVSNLTGLGERRYAYREMLYRQLMEEGCDYQYVSGPELVTTTGKVDRFIQEGGNYSANQETDLGQRTQYGY